MMDKFFWSFWAFLVVYVAYGWAMDIWKNHVHHHDWSKWERNFPVSNLQNRECNKCGKIQERWIL